MLIAPTADDLRIATRATGLVVGGFSLAIVALVPVGLLLGEVNAATALAIGAAPGIVAGALARRIPRKGQVVTWTLGVIMAVASWGACALLASVPLWLSGHYVGWHHALFDAMSGLTNTGLTLVADLDHLPRTLVLLRSLLELAGGFAFLVLGASLLASPSVLASSLDSVDVRGERVLPRLGLVLRRARLLLGGLFGLGAGALAVAMLVAGVPSRSVVVHAIAIAAAAGTTGGFAPQSDGMASYHSAVVETVAVVLMLGGATAIGVWVAASRRQYREIGRDLNTRVFAVVVLATLAGIVFGLARAGTFDTVVPLARHGMFLAVAAATTTGLSTVDPAVLISDYGALAPTAMVAAMTIGGMFGSMAGGVGTLRSGLLVKGIVGDVRGLLGPQGAVTREGWWRMGHRQAVTDAHVRSAAMIVLLAVGAILVGAMVLLWTDPTIDLRLALFAAASTVSNTGLDMPAMRPDLGVVVTITHAMLMLMGRLEWLGVFAFAGFAIALVRGHR